MSPNPLLQRAKTEGNPIIDGEQVTFVWEGKTAPNIIGDFNGWGWDQTKSTLMTEAASGVWTHTLKLPGNAYIEYFYTNDLEDEDARVDDPLNQRRITNGFGKFNCYFDMPDAQHTPLFNLKKNTPRGIISQHRISTNYLSHDGKRDLWLYAPPVKQPVPLLVVYDGKDYLRRARLPQMVDNLIAQDKIQPIALALIQHAGRGRFGEYDSSEAGLSILMNLVLPLARQHLSLIDEPGAYGVCGASMGGLMALYTGLRLPEIFGKVISQSGAFQFDFGKTEALIKVLLKLLPRQPLTIWQDVGQFEWLLATNRQMHTLLKQQGYNVIYREQPGGHNYTSWRDQLPDALIATFGK